jgi:hypothetical protein
MQWMSSPAPLAVIAAVTSGGNASDVAKTKSPSGMECRVLALPVIKRRLRQRAKGWAAPNQARA